MRHLDTIAPNGIDADLLVSLYVAHQPIGSGPLQTQRTLCALIEQLAMDRDIVLPPAKGLPKQKKQKQSKPAAPPKPALIVRVRECISEQVGIKINPGIDDEQPWEDFGLDSLDLVEIVMRLEDEFDITIPDSLAVNLTSVKMVMEHLEMAGVK